MHKLAKSTNQKPKVNKDLDFKQCEVFTEFDSLGVSGHFAPFMSIKEICSSSRKFNSSIYAQNENVAHNRPDLMDMLLRHTPRSPYTSRYPVIENFNKFSELTANVVFDKVNARWIAICEQLSITKHANDMEAVVEALEETLSKHKFVSSEYHLSIIFNKYVNSENRISTDQIEELTPMGVVQFFTAPKPHSAVAASYIMPGAAVIPVFEQVFEYGRKMADAILPKRTTSINTMHLQQVSKGVTALALARSDKAKADKSVINNEFPIIDIATFSSLLAEESYTMPSGLTREQKLEWLSENQMKNQNTK